MTEHPQTPSRSDDEHTAPLPERNAPGTPPTGARHSSPSAPRGWRHPLQLTHLVMGLAFAGLVGLWALLTAGVVATPEVRWLLPVPWLVAGAVGLGAWAVAQRRALPPRSTSAGTSAPQRGAPGPGSPGSAPPPPPGPE